MLYTPLGFTPIVYRHDACSSCVNVLRYKRESLKILGSVGEPINPEAWMWYHNVVGGGHCAIVDTFWQTETVLSCLLPVTYSCSVGYFTGVANTPSINCK